MGLVAVIARKPRLSMPEWIECIRRIENLRRPVPKEGMNPFTGSPKTFHPRRDEADILRDDSVVGGIEASPEFDDDGELHVYGSDSNDEAVRATVSAVAKQLNANMEWLPDECSTESSVSLSRLLQVVSPPIRPVEAGEGNDWAAIEEKLGTGLPTDYKAYIRTFGTGCLDGFIWVFNPFSANPNLNLFHRIEASLQALRQLRAQDASEVSYPLFPEAGGLLPWGATDNGDGLSWLTMGKPDEWSIVVNAARDPRTEHYTSGMADSLAQLLVGAAVSRIFPDDFRDSEHTFVAVR